MLSDETIYFLEQRPNELVYHFYRYGEQGRYMISALQASASKLDVKSVGFIEKHVLPNVVWHPRDPQPARGR